MSNQRSPRPAGGPTPGRLSRLAADLRPHAVPMLHVGLGTVIGAGCALLFQVVSARALGAADFGLLAAFLAVLAAIGMGASAIQTSVAVAAAQAATAFVGEPRRHKKLTAAAGIGIVVTVALATLSVPLAQALHTQPMVVLLTSLTALPTLLLSERVGLLQGAGRPSSAIWSSTISLVVRLALAGLAWALGWSIAGMVGAVVVGVITSLTMATILSRGIDTPSYTVLSGIGRNVMLLSALWAWLINADVIILRIGANLETAGQYASASVLPKASVLVPATLAFYLLPRFVRNRDNPELTKRGQRIVMMLTFAVGAAISLVFWAAGPLIARLAFGAGYETAGQLLLPISVAFIPWLVSQAVLIRITANPRIAVIVFVAVVAIIQVPVMLAASIDVHAAIAAQGGLGLVSLLGLLIADRNLNRVVEPAKL